MNSERYKGYDELAIPGFAIGSPLKIRKKVSPHSSATKANEMIVKLTSIY